MKVHKQNIKRAGSSESRNISSSYFCALVIESWKTKFSRVVRLDNAQLLGVCLFFFSLSFLLQMHFTIFFLFFFRLRHFVTNAFFLLFEKTRSGSGCIVMKHNGYRAKRSVQSLENQLSKTKAQKWFPCRLNYSLGFYKNPTHCSSTCIVLVLEQAFLSTAL